ncbi:glycosyltransferase [Rhodococcus ruber]|uniref:glycosyltransferase n=1 Tax=Rhodococcus ruber TaxID=1830 RepID=UPI001F1D5EED|nr:glycosyltransferase [Rhodococcus ruber]MCF8781344.1 glycosyltransferase [Rhodococcus ruber]
MTRSVAILGTRGYPSYYGGFETLIRRLAPYLADQGWSVTVYGRKGATASKESERDPRVQVVDTWGIESKSLSTLTYGLSSSLSTAVKKPDAALIMNVANGYWVPMLRTANIPTLMNVDGIEWERAKWGKAAKTVFRIGATLTAKYADHLIYDSPVIKQRWATEFDRDGTYIPYGGDIVGDLKPVPGLKRGCYALMVARFVPENTVPEFLEAARQIAQNYDVVIVGSSGYGGEIEREVQQLTDSNPRVRWMGHVSNDAVLFSLWQNAGAYFHGHSVGGTNPALVQAMACGAPTIARDTPFNRHVMGSAGTFCAPDPQDISTTIIDLLNDKDRQLNYSRNAQRRAERLFGWEQVCAAYEAALYSVIGRSTGVNNLARS